MLILTISIATGPGHPSQSVKGPLPSMAHRVLPCAESPARDFGGIIFIYGGYCCPFDAVPNNNQGKWLVHIQPGTGSSRYMSLSVPWRFIQGKVFPI